MTIKNYIPNTITSMNLLCGVMGVIFTLNGRPDIAFLLMLAASVFDFCDGLAARALDAYSDIGKELDSLCDMVSFGVLPSLMLFETVNYFCGDSFWCYIPLVLAVFSALRLAKFNVDERQHDSFIGLPTPSAAMICGSICYAAAVNPSSGIAAICSHVWVLPLLSVILSALLVCELPMFSFKFKKGESVDKATQIKRIAFIASLAVMAIVVAVAHLNWSIAVALSLICYILISLIAAII